MSNATMQALATEIVQDCVATIRKEIGHNVRVDRIEWSDRMSKTWGVAQLRTYNGERVFIIKLASKIFTKDTKAFRSTVAHEVAHLADFQIYKKWGHGNTWKWIMKVLGQDAERCVTAEEHKEVGYKHQKKAQSKYVYKCECQEHAISGIKHARIRKGRTYSCVHCRTRIVFSGKKAA